MNLIKQSVELIPQKDLFEHIERCARVCYKSEDKQSEHSEEFVNKLIANKHLAMLEHGTVYLKMPGLGLFNQIQEHTYQDYINDKYSKVCMSYEKKKETDFIVISYANITTNLRVLQEHNWLDDLQYLCEPTENHEKRYTVKIITSIGIVRELLRHRKFSFANESTRYCNYSNDSKFEEGITFIEPYWLPNKGVYEIDRFVSSLYDVEACYNDLCINCSAQQAREVLPLCTKSELIMTGFQRDWEDFLDKRLKESTGKVHPDMKQLAEMINDKLNLV